MNWDNLIKDIPEDTPPSDGRGFAAIPPPPEHDEEVDPRAEISSDPVKYTVSEMKAVDPKLLTVNSGSGVAIGNKRESGDDKEGKADGPAAKKSKGESFKEKEKRKRDLGMSSRGKSFVEEEKRILREQFN